jgi:hypothetical protein
MTTDIHIVNPPIAAASSPTAEPGSAVVGEDPHVQEAEQDQSMSELLLSPSAKSYYLSLLLHLVAYAVAAIVFTLLGHHLLDQDEIIPPIRASLDEFDRQGDQPQFETTSEISVTPMKTESAIERISNNLTMAENGTVSSRPEDLLPSFASTEAEGAEDGGAEFMFKMPESGLAVTKGSFTVWSEPEVPQPGQPYRLIVQVRLPDNIKAYRINDLSGRLVGTDDYEQKIPYDPSAPNNLFYTDENLDAIRITSGSESVKVRDNKIQLMIIVPPARRLVKDTIEIRSRRLHEKQELELVFGGARP